MKIEVNAFDILWTYAENFWTGKKSLSLDGIPANRYKRNAFFIEHKKDINIIVKGNFLFGITLYLSDGTQIVIAKNKWYDWILIFLPILTVFYGMRYGAIGGGIVGVLAAFGMIANASILRKKTSTMIKIYICLATSILVILTWFLFLNLFL